MRLSLSVSPSLTLSLPLSVFLCSWLSLYGSLFLSNSFPLGSVSLCFCLCLSVSLSLSLHVCLSVDLYLSLSVPASLSLSISLSPSVFLSLYMAKYQSHCSTDLVAQFSTDSGRLGVGGRLCLYPATQQTIITYEKTQTVCP